jgi:hypothetical protein
LASPPVGPRISYEPSLAQHEQFNQSGQHEDLNEAINACYALLNALNSEHPMIYSVSTNLGELLMITYSNTCQSEYMEKAMAVLECRNMQICTYITMLPHCKIMHISYEFQP